MNTMQFIPQGNTADDVDEAYETARLVKNLALKLVGGSHACYESQIDMLKLAAPYAQIVAMVLLERRQKNY